MASLAIVSDNTALDSFDAWCERGKTLCETARSISWDIGDWWADGSHRYGERAKVAAEGIFGREFQTLANAASVARAFQGSRRREVLTFMHHAEVASLPPHEADRLLDQAVSSGTPARQLRTIARLRKLDLGIIKPADVVPDDAETAAMKKIQFTWNGATVDIRRYIAEAIADAAERGYEDIDL